jgi:TRAP-type mannitol/chloroaromatic compound transport system permease small subunit
LAIILGISRVIDAITGTVGRAVFWVSFIMVLVGAFNVITRYAFGPIANVFGNDVAQALSGNRYLSLQTFAFDLVFMLGASYVLIKDGHVRVDILYSRFGPRARATIDIVGTALFLIPFALMGLRFSQSYVASSWSRFEASADPGGIPVFLFKTLIPVMLIMLLAQGVSEILKNSAFLAGAKHSRSVHAAPEPPPADGATADLEGA